MMLMDPIITMIMLAIKGASGSKTEEEYEDEISDQEVEAFLTTVIFVGILTIFLFTIFQRSRKTNVNDGTSNVNNIRNTGDPAAIHMQRQQALFRHAEQEQQMQFQRRHNNAGREEDDLGTIPVPPPDSKFKLLIDGVLPFRHGDAKDFNLEAKQKNSKQDVIVASLGHNQLTRGCNVVLTIKGSELVKKEVNSTETPISNQLESICNALTILGSEYNLFLILDFDNESVDICHMNQVKDIISVPPHVLPKHRIVAAQSVTGRVAFVRQLRPELVVDHDIEVQKQLTRFGFKVHIYGNGTGSFGRLCELLI